ncbi:hypothetical protein, partial [Enterobacter intestinihominis]
PRPYPTRRRWEPLPLPVGVGYGVGKQAAKQIPFRPKPLGLIQLRKFNQLVFLPVSYKQMNLPTTPIVCTYPWSPYQ